MSYPFYITDVFTSKPYRGNQLATVILEEEIPDSEMLDIAREFNFSETTFVLNPEYGNTLFKTRIFTPAGEVPFAGHPTLGTAWLMHQYYNRDANLIRLDLPIGVIPVDISPDILWMTQNAAEFSEIIGKDEVCPLINLSMEDIRDDLPIQYVSTGLPAIIIPLKSLDAVRRAHSSKDLAEKFFKNRTPAAIYVFAEETYHQENQLNARVFVDAFGISEDPATGSATGCLGGYLTKYLKKDISLSIEQGFEINRNSILKLRVTDGIIQVGGSVAPVARGELY